MHRKLLVIGHDYLDFIIFGFTGLHHGDLDELHALAATSIQCGASDTALVLDWVGDTDFDSDGVFSVCAKNGCDDVFMVAGNPALVPEGMVILTANRKDFRAVGPRELYEFSAHMKEFAAKQPKKMMN